MRNSIKSYLVLFLKGTGMGAANIIPGVSGGTIALITGIFETLINSLKSLNIKAIKLFFTGHWKEFAKHINLGFLIAVFGGIALSIITLAKLFDYLFINYPVLVWAFFFGLILASVYFVGRTINNLNFSVVVTFIVGTGVALAISLFKPAQENSQFYYLIMCGIVAICSMILPGLSGSFVLILLGNYQLVMIEAVSNFDLGILLPVILGAIFGLIAFSHLLAMIFKRFRNQTISLLTGFMLGSLMMLWPWKQSLFQIDNLGKIVMNRSDEPLLIGYKYLLPKFDTGETWIALVCIIVGIACITLLELKAGTNKPDEE